MSRETETRAALVVPPDVDMSASMGFLAALDDLLDPPGGDVVLDCSKLHGVSSSQVRVLWHARVRCMAAGARMRLVAVAPGLDRVLRVLDLHPLFIVETGSPVGVGEARPASPKSGAPLAFEIRCEPSVQGIDKAASEFRDFLVRLGLPEICTFDLGTVFYEVATNIRQHAGLRSGESLSFSAVPKNGKMRLRFVDSGRPFDPVNNLPALDMREVVKRRQNRGLGLALIARLMDSISYRHIDGCNVLVLEKVLKHQRRGCNVGTDED